MKNASNDTNFQTMQRVEIHNPDSLWQKTLRECVTNIDELFQLLELPSNLKNGATSANQLFPLKVPRRYLSLIEKANPSDPLLLQILPLKDEHANTLGFTDDPLQELNYMDSPGIIHKYQGRLLLTITGACSVNCRYCFRRNFPYSESNPSNKHWQKSLEYIQNNPDLSEIILSGGDPLLVSDKKLASILKDLSNINHIKRIRIHSRVPVFLPERITTELLEIFKSTRFNLIVVIHSNHPRELDNHVAECLLLMKKSGITLLNQSVLLKGVNDNASTLVQLSEKLFELGTLPYYLHLLDKVSGTAHFNLTHNDSEQIYREMQAYLPGYLVPKLVRDIPGKSNKTILS